KYYARHPVFLRFAVHNDNSYYLDMDCCELLIPLRRSFISRTDLCGPTGEFKIAACDKNLRLMYLSSRQRRFAAFLSSCSAVTLCNFSNKPAPVPLVYMP